MDWPRMGDQPIYKQFIYTVNWYVLPKCDRELWINDQLYFIPIHKYIA